MREPRFWSREVDPRSREAAPLLRFLLTPLAWVYAQVTRQRISRVEPHSVSPIVICIGNLTAGGVGKSPVVAALRAHIQDVHMRRVATLSRGYKGRLKGPIRVDTRHHQASDVGDEPLMLAATGEAWIGADRAAAGTAMSAAGVDVILMDEPASALDPIATQRIEQLMREELAGYTIVIVTHNMQQAQRASDMTCFFNIRKEMREDKEVRWGELVEMAPTEDLFHNPQSEETHDYISGRFG